MKIGIDLDGTAWKYREFFKEFILGFKSRGHILGIITSHVNLKEADIRLWKARGFPDIDFYISKVEGEEAIPSREWKINKSKENNIDYLIDNFDTDDILIVPIMDSKK